MYHAVMKHLPLVGLGLLILLGILLHGSYSIPMDETIMHNLGIKAVEYIQGISPWPDDPANRYHGPLVEIIIHSTQRLLGTSEVAAMAAVRHFITYLFFVGGVVAFYFLARRQTKSDLLAMIGALFLVLSPRIFGHAFFNSRDIPFMALFTVSMLCLSIFLESKTIKSAILFGLATAAALSVRSMGVFVPLFAFILLAPRSKSDCTLLGIYGLSAALFTYLFWPLLWAGPIKHFIEAVTFSSSFAETHALYVPVWIAVTTPVLYTFLTLLGVGISLRFWKDQLLPLLWITLPLFTMIVLGAGIYNGWRHVFFLYPAVLLFTLTGLAWCLNRFNQKIVFGLVIFSSIYTAVWMGLNHPLQSTYFSVPIESFERDYWALSSRTALDAIVEADEAPIITIFATNRIALINAYAYYEDRIFLEAESDAVADYIIDFTDGQEYRSVLEPLLLTEIRSGRLTVASVYKGPLLDQKVRNIEEDKKKLTVIQSQPRAPWEYGSYSRKTD